MGQYTGLFFCLLSFFNMSQSKLKLKFIKVLVVCMGFEPGAAGWKAKTNQLSYGGTPFELFVLEQNV